MEKYGTHFESRIFILVESAWMVIQKDPVLSLFSQSY